MQDDLRHRLVSELKDIASQLNKVPTRKEFRQHSKMPVDSFERLFGGYTPFLQAAGFQKQAKEKPNILEVKLDQFLTPSSKSLNHSLGIQRKILVIGDIHFPFVNVNALTAIYLFIANNPDITDIVQVGDFYDLFSWSKFPRSHLVISPKEEIERGRAMGEEMWAKIKAMLPNASLYQLMGNHDIRPLKRVIELAPELEVFIELHRWFQFDGVELIKDAREWLTIDKYHFTHGHLGKLGDHCIKYRKNVVCGHSHRAGLFVMPMQDRDEILVELNVGYIGDENSKALSYTPVKTKQWTLGFGLIDEWGPRFISL